MALPESSGDGSHASHGHNARTQGGMMHDAEATDMHTDMEGSHTDHAGQAEDMPVPHDTTEQEHHNHQH